MKYFAIPCVILALILALSLFNANAMDNYVSDWCEELDAAQTAANSTADTSFAKGEVRITYVSSSSSTGCGGTMVEIACL